MTAGVSRQLGEQSLPVGVGGTWRRFGEGGGVRASPSRLLEAGSLEGAEETFASGLLVFGPGNLQTGERTGHQTQTGSGVGGPTGTRR